MFTFVLNGVSAVMNAQVMDMYTQVMDMYKFHLGKCSVWEDYTRLL